MSKTGKWITGIIVAGLVGLSAGTLALGRHDGRMGGHGWGGPFADPAKMARLAERLDLSTAQRDQIDDLIHQARGNSREYFDGLMAARKQLREEMHSGSFDEKSVRTLAKAMAAQMEELMVLRAKSFAEMRALLTEGQQEKLAQMKHRGHRGHRGHRSQ